MPTLTAAIKAEAQRLGFVLVGVTTPDPPPHHAHYERWLQAGRHGEMAYLSTARARQARANPRLLLPECRSILALAIPHPPTPLSASGEGGRGVRARIASYALGDDYHDVLPGRLRRLGEFIEAQVGAPVPNRWYTDTGPLLERELAQRAGLGWIGKNTCLINPQHGSYFLLAELLLGIELEPDPPFLPDRCGSCTRCIEACPTGCILPDRSLDARRCISYLTIELKGAIPHELRPLTGEWAFGCDICQQVCPWNERFAALQGDPAFFPRPSLPQPDPSLEITLTAQEFNRKYSGSPLKRAKRRGYLRNLAVVLGNSHSQQVIAALQHALSDPEHLVRRHVAWALGQIPGEAAQEALFTALKSEADPEVRQEINQSLEHLTK
jgi:epoxyqueuosine reductase